MSRWKQTGDYHVKTYRPKTVWERINAFLDGLAKVGGAVLLLVILAVIFG